ncbi:MAG: leader peptidase (prepilin peptidase)/N-methyltransferase, partial [Kangiellaceae bacterium]
MENIAIIELLAQSPIAFIIFTFVISLLVGSFLNVVIYRLPIMMEREWQRDIEQTQNP